MLIDGLVRHALGQHWPKMALALASSTVFVLSGCKDDKHDVVTNTVVVDGGVMPCDNDASTVTGSAAARLSDEGRQTFRFDTFGDEAFWGDTLKLHQAIAGGDAGGVGTGVSPKTALSVGLKVDVDALPAEVVTALKAGQVNLDDPATTLTLLKANAVVGVKGIFGGAEGGADTLTSMGITCALCHSTVDDSLTAGIGHRLDGWPNRDLNVGAIISLAPNLQAIATLLSSVPGSTPVTVDDVKKVLAAWGPGKFDAELPLDGKGFKPDGTTTAAVLIPAAYGLGGVNLHTYTGWGSIPYWNAFVAILEMHGVGNFYDTRLDNATQFPIAAQNKFGHIQVAPDKDQVSSKLAGLQIYQLSLPTPTPSANVDAGAAANGKTLFNDKAKCWTCHVPPAYTEPGWNLHRPAEVGADPFHATRSPTGMYRTTPLRGVSTRKGGFFHDAQFATLTDVVNHYNTLMGLQLSANEVSDLVEYLNSL